MTIALIVIGLVLLIYSGQRKNILLSVCAGLVWFSLFLWFFFEPSGSVFNLERSYVKILSWVFLMLTFVPFLFLMDVNIQHEKEGSKWSEWGARPKDRKTSYETYKEELRRRVRK